LKWQKNNEHGGIKTNVYREERRLKDKITVQKKDEE